MVFNFQAETMGMETKKVHQRNEVPLSALTLFLAKRITLMV